MGADGSPTKLLRTGTPIAQRLQSQQKPSIAELSEVLGRAAFAD